MRSLSFVRASILGLALCGGGLALADVAPPPDGGSKPADMATTMAQPDMTASTSDDGGCSMAGHGVQTSSAAALFVGAALLFRRRRLA